jgi:hypothetical protein
MKISDLLRNLADTIDAEEAPEPISAPGALSPMIAPAEPVTLAPTSDAFGGEKAQQPDDLFVPPLQLKMELLKKAVDVDSIYDDDGEEEIEQHSYPNQMMQIRRNAGLNPAVASELGDDEPLES